jgi:hypothetical protein
MLRRTLLTGLWLCLSSSVQAATFSFTKVADTGTLIPDGTGAFTTLREASVDQGVVVFRASGGGGQEGIYRWFNGSLSRVADLTDSAPDTGNPFVVFTDPTVDNGQIVFQALSQAPASVARTGIYLYNGGASTVVSQGDTMPPGANTFGSFSARPSHSAGDSGFLGDGTGPTRGIYAKIGGTVTRVADATMLTPDSTGAIPSGATAFSTFGNADISGGNVAFGAASVGAGGRRGIFNDVGGLHAVADFDTPIPNGMGNFNGFQGTAPLEINVSFDDGNTAFIAFGPNFGPGTQSGVYADFGGSLDRIADRDLFMPEGGTVRFGSFGGVSIDGGEVVFQAIGLGSSLGGIYSTIGGTLDRVLDSTQSLDGLPIASNGIFPVSRDGFDGNSIVFRVNFANGNNAIYIANLIIPEPSTLALVFGAAGCIALRRGRRSC